METKNNNVSIVSLSNFEDLSIGDIFLFSVDGYKYVFLGKSDGLFCYKRCELRDKHCCRRNRLVFKMDANGGLFIANGELFVDYESALTCATRL